MSAATDRARAHAEQARAANQERTAKPAPGTWEHDLATALTDVQQKLATVTAIARQPLFGLDAVELLARSFDGPGWLVDGLITRVGTTIGAGEPKAGIKTWMLIEGALAVATGTRMFGEFFAEAGRVAFFFAEDHAQSVKSRVRALMKGAGRELAPDRLYLQPRGEFIDVLKDADLAWLVASCRKLGTLDLLVLDPLRDIHGGEEDKSDSMRDVMRRLRVLGELLGCTVWCSHHTPKANKDTAKRRPGQNLRGSSAIHGSIDSGLYIEPLEGDGTNVFRAQVTSQIKAGRSAGTFDLELAIVDDADGAAECATWRFTRADFRKGPAKANKDDEAVFAFVRELAMKGETLTRTALRLHDSRPIPEKRTSAALDRLIEAGRLRVHGGRVHVAGHGGQECSAND